MTYEVVRVWHKKAREDNITISAEQFATRADKASVALYGAFREVNAALDLWTRSRKENSNWTEIATTLRKKLETAWNVFDKPVPRASPLAGFDLQRYSPPDATPPDATIEFTPYSQRPESAYSLPDTAAPASRSHSRDSFSDRPQKRSFLSLGRSGSTASSSDGSIRSLSPTQSVAESELSTDARSVSSVHTFGRPDPQKPNARNDEQGHGYTGVSDSLGRGRSRVRRK
jgi:hypothetical protein